MTEYQKTYIELKKQFVATNEGPDSVRALYTFKEELEQSEDQQAKEVLETVDRPNAGMLVDTLHAHRSKVTVEDVRKFGMIPEFLGRLPILFTLEPLSEDTLVRILQEPKNAILKQYEKLLAMDEVKLAFDEDALRAIAHKAKEKKVGARALRAVIEEFMLDIMYEIPKDDNIGMVTITKDYVEKKGSPVITLRGCIGIGSTENPQIAASN